MLESLWRTGSFTANSWTTVAEGTYNFNGAGAQLFCASKVPPCRKMMPIRNSSASRTSGKTGKHMTFNLTDKKGTDQNGLTITQLVVPEQATPFTYE